MSEFGLLQGQFHGKDPEIQNTAPYAARVAKARAEEEQQEHEYHLRSSWETLCKAQEIKRNSILMADLKRWVAVKRAEIEAQIKLVDL